jgi:hypothetical protein
MPGVFLYNAATLLRHLHDRQVEVTTVREESRVDRVRTAIVFPIVVFAVCAAIAIGVGMLLHLVHNVSHGSGSPFIEEFATPLMALALVLAVTAAGFIASAGAGPAPEHR